MTELGLSTVRDVEDLIISSVYHGILVGKLNSEKQQLVVESTHGRDVRAHEIDNMVRLGTDALVRSLFCRFDRLVNGRNN